MSDSPPDSPADATPHTTPRIIVLDAGPMIALLSGEDGADVVQAALNEAASGAATVYAHALNLVEVFYHYARLADETTAREAMESLAADGIERREDMDAAFCQDIARLKTAGRVSLADCCGVALTRRLGGEFYTTDRHELTALQSRGVASITFIK